MNHSKIPQPAWLHSEHFIHLFTLAHVMPDNRFKVLAALIHYLEPETLKSTATREQIREHTGLSLSTIYRIIKEFLSVDLIRQWRGPYLLKQCFYLLSLPVEPAVIEFYSGSKSQKQDRPLGSGDEVKTEEDAMKQQDQQLGPVLGLQLVEVAPASAAESVVESHRPEFDPQIQQVLDTIQQNPSRNPVAGFLEHLGFLRMNRSNGPGHLDRERLLQWLMERDCNNFSRFAELVADFKAAPAIDLPMTTPVSLVLHNKLSTHPLGLWWLKDNMALVVKDRDGGPLDESEIRSRLLEFMRERGIRGIDELAAIAQEEHGKELARRREARAFSPELPAADEFAQESEKAGLANLAGGHGGTDANLAQDTVCSATEKPADGVMYH